MSRLLIVSNRLPVTMSRKDGNLTLESSAGGLATGLGSIYRTRDSLWIGWPGVSRERIGDRQEEIKARLAEDRFYPVWLTQHDVENHYYGFCNKTIWPLFHYLSLYTIYSKNYWEAYKRVNMEFCDEVVSVANEDDVIWIQDYHLMLLPRMIREKMPDSSIGFFLHIPFVSSEVFRLLPWRREILEGLLGADLLGFHTYDYVHHFVESVRRVTGYEHSFGDISVGGRTVKVDAFPMGIDYQKFSGAERDRKVQKEIKRIRDKVGERKVVLSIDRLDYTKGIPERLEIFDMFLDKYPEYREKVTMILVAVPSRTGVEHYRMLKRRLDELIGRINGKYGTLDWMPVWYLYRSLPFNMMVALYNVADICLVTPLRDGMNLIAKEFIASKEDGTGVLILSEMAGAAKELGEALIVNPNNKEEIVEAMRTAFTIPPEEQVVRNKVMQDRLSRYSIAGWVDDFMDCLAKAKARQHETGVIRLTDKKRERLRAAYHDASDRLILLDYDGTLVPFVDRPEKASPDPEILDILKAFACVEGNEVVLVSGRDRDTLEQWFGDLDIGMVAEHGVWTRDRGGAWEMIEALKDDWKSEMKPLLELYVDRTPGSFVEEKSYSLSWHYRKADARLASVRAKELKEDLIKLTENLGVRVLEGSKVIELKDAGVNKGRAAARWLGRKGWDFVLAIGDDWTDEDMFDVLPDTAYSIKVGLRASKARFNIDSQEDVRVLLKELRATTCEA
ncbi:MAG: bifunctional alpha,alpha-trehalose-phosphate synthase (UDP-forming)/trehalose-phosphatase [bacterium]|jgi:trehalose 6-phosphate synthase/phosphatase